MEHIRPEVGIVRDEINKRGSTIQVLKERDWADPRLRPAI